MIANVKQRLHITVVSPGFQCESLVDTWYNSLKAQSYPYWTAIAIDDVSTDGTFEKLQYIAKNDSRVQVIRRTEHYYQLGNWVDVIDRLDPEEYVVRLDLDDSLGSKYVFESLVKEILYRDTRLITITEFSVKDMYNNDASARWNHVEGSKVLETGWLGESVFCFKARDFQSIPPVMLTEDSSGEYYKVAGDVAITLPLLVICSKSTYHLFLPQALRYYNIRPQEFDDDYVVDESGKREQFRVAEEVFKKLIKYYGSETRSLP